MAFHEMCYETNCQQYFVCKINAKLYLPLNRKRNLSGKFSVIFRKFLKIFAKKKQNSVASASKDGRQPEGKTTWDAIRIIETGNGLYLDVTDFTFATSEGVQEY